MCGERGPTPSVCTPPLMPNENHLIKDDSITSERWQQRWLLVVALEV